MSALYEESHRQVQRQFDTQRLADPRYIHQYALVERSKLVSHEGAATPLPDWKQMEWARDVLPHDDPARSES